MSRPDSLEMDQSVSVDTDPVRPLKLHQAANLEITMATSCGLFTLHGTHSLERDPIKHVPVESWLLLEQYEGLVIRIRIRIRTCRETKLADVETRLGQTCLTSFVSRFHRVFEMDQNQQ